MEKWPQKFIYTVKNVMGVFFDCVVNFWAFFQSVNFDRVSEIWMASIKFIEYYSWEAQNTCVYGVSNLTSFRLFRCITNYSEERFLRITNYSPERFRRIVTSKISNPLGDCIRIRIHKQPLITPVWLIVMPPIRLGHPGGQTDGQTNGRTGQTQARINIPLFHHEIYTNSF